jgi:hypothetical protein
MSYSAAMPGVMSAERNQAKEKGLCGIDFYSVAEASYPKTWECQIKIAA